jgi:hypothetical protein
MDGDDLAALRGLSQVAFAARCVRRILDTLGPSDGDRLYISVGNGFVQTEFPRIARQIESVAKTGKRLSVSDMNSLKSEVFRARVDFEEIGGPKAQKRNSFASIADALAAAIELAALEDGPRAHRDTEAVAQYAIEAAGFVSTKTEQMVREAQANDIRWLLSMKDSTGSAQVPASLLGALWQKGKPTDPAFGNGPAFEKEPMSAGSSDRRLILTLDTPAEMDENARLVIAKELVLRLNALHHAYGGHGLEIDDDNIFVIEESLIPTGDR